MSAATVSPGELEKVILAFKEATRPENEKHRRELMEERVKASISLDGACTITSNKTGKGKAVDARPDDSPSAPGPESISADLPVELTEEQEAAIAKHLEEAKAAIRAIAQAKATGPPNESQVISPALQYERQVQTLFAQLRALG